MKNLMILSSALMFAACGISEDKFADEFVTTYCDAYTACTTSDADCPVSASGDDDDDSCDFDKAAAKDCLDGEYTCDDSLGEGFEFVLPPTVCADVCGSAGDDDDDTTGNTTTSGS